MKEILNLNLMVITRRKEYISKAFGLEGNHDKNLWRNTSALVTYILNQI